MSADESERQARACLLTVGTPGDPRLYELVQRAGAADAWSAVLTGRGLPLELAGLRHKTDPRSAADALVRGVERGLRLVVPGDLEWPSQLEDLTLAGAGRTRPSTPPLALWLRGKENLRLALLRSAAVVGSRASTPYGNRVAAELGAGLAEHGYATVSGAAYGIDASAHRGALAVGGLTVAVLACGADMAYPSGHTALIDRVGAEGVVVSELPPGSHPSKVRFLERNRLIAALTRGTVVVEAAARSGALNTAAWARRMNRPVLGIPGPVTSTLSAGVHAELVARRAELVTGAGDVVGFLDPLTGPVTDTLFELPDSTPGRLAGEEAEASADQLDPISGALLAAVPVRVPVSVQELGRLVGVTPDIARQRLAVLRAMGLVEPCGDGWRLLGALQPRSPRRARPSPPP